MTDIQLIVTSAVSIVTAITSAIIAIKAKVDVRKALKDGKYYVICPKCGTKIQLKDVEVYDEAA